MKEFLESHTQREAAEIIGCTQGAIWQMVKNGRDIRFRVSEGGDVAEFFEIKKPKTKAA